MEHASKLPVDPLTGIPVWLPDEVQYRLCARVDAWDGAVQRKVLRGCSAAITSHRLALLDDAAGPNRRGTHASAWLLSQVVAMGPTEGSGGLFGGSPKLELRIRAAGPPPMRAPPAPALLRLSFKESGRDAALEALRTAMVRAAWAAAPPPPARALGPPSAPAEVIAAPPPASLAGIGGIVRRQEEDRRQESALASEALSDLGELERHAKAMVRLAEDYASSVARRRAAATLAAGAGTEGAGASSAGAGNSAGASESTAAGDDLSALVATLGITNPVTRAAAGSLYDVEVARQLAAFVRPLLDRCGGMLALTDAYCLYNRARATELLSPDDLLAAARTAAALRLGVHLRAFPSGLVVLEADGCSDATVAARATAALREMTASSPAGAPAPYLTAFALAARWRVTLQVAAQQLLLAEAAGALARDDSLAGLRFYENRFVPGCVAR